ncbi:muscle M-line assembly protein unc-89-like isoform X8 [Penaeus chinensis]|uniref:muscle M-line assembly protein unc-89-like isoform X8 n=1 Tax=Penaeus chinensis TaxID=139456 RepID=UPI001FB5F4F9|nr:muscle M-line assembly protein unc-89-like isoform X8 [Penaeus chinensis]
MANQQFCLRWNNYQSNLTQVFDQLLQSESFVDVTLSCEGNSVKAHRMVLSACSPYFQGLLSDAPCSHPVIILQGVKWPELKAVVEFMYKGEINICQEQLGSLLRVAESLKIRGLAEVDGDGGESAVLTSPAASPAARPLHTSLDDSSISPTLAAIARKRRRLSGDDISRPCTPATPTSAPELMDTVLDLPPPLGNRGGSGPLPGSPVGLPSLAAHLPGPMPPPAPMPHHLPHLPPLSPLLNMHHIHRHHTPDDFEIRPGIAEMIREEERRRRDAPDMAKLLESSHHWMGTSMADGGGPVFPSMFPDPPNTSKASKTAGSSSKAAAAAATPKTVAMPLSKVQQPPPAPLPPSSSAPAIQSALNPLAKQDTISSTSKPVTHKISITSVVSSASGLPSITTAANGSAPDNTVSITAAAGKPGPSAVSPEPKVITITTSAVTGGISSPAAAPQHFRGHSNNTVTHARGPNAPGRLIGKAALEGTWESIQGAVSAPKSGASRWTQSDLVAALALVKAGTPIKPAAERCNIPVMTLWRRTRALGIVSSKVQCGFRYPAGRGRSKTEPDHNTFVKCENEDALPLKAKHESNCPPRSEPRLVIQPKTEPQDGFKEVVVQRAGPLREMSALHALCRVASRENSPRPLGRENSPLPLGRENSPKPIGRENSPKPFGRENSLKPLGRENSPRPYGRENSPRPLGRENSPRPFGRENSPKLLSRENSPRPFGRENSPKPLGRENIPRPLRREGSPMVLGKENSPRPAAREKMPQLNAADSPSPEFRDPKCQQQILEESPSPLVAEKRHSESSSRPPSLRDDESSNLEVSEKEGSPRPPPRGPGPAGGADRFRAWVDIVLEGAGRHHQQEIPQDLSTRHQRATEPSPPHSQPTSSCTSTAASTTAPQNPSPSPVHE